MSDPTIITLPDGQRALVDALGCVHPPRALVRAITYLDQQAAFCAAHAYPDTAAWLHQAADQRRVWLQQLEATTEVPHVHE